MVGGGGMYAIGGTPAGHYGITGITGGGGNCVGIPAIVGIPYKALVGSGQPLSIYGFGI